MEHAERIGQGLETEWSSWKLEEKDVDTIVWMEREDGVERAVWMKSWTDVGRVLRGECLGDEPRFWMVK